MVAKQEVSTPPIGPTPTPPPEGKKIGRRAVVIGGLAGGASLVAYGVEQQIGLFSGIWNGVRSLLRQREENLKRAEYLENRSLAPQPGEKVDWWQELSEEQIRARAVIPNIDIIGDQYVSTVSKILQEKARQAGYRLIYQRDPQDTVGRTVIARGREVHNKAWTAEDLGFGRVGGGVRGIFKAWVPDPNDPSQKEKIYALLRNPQQNTEYLVGVRLFPFTGGDRPTWFVVDNLDYGPDYIRQKIEIAGYDITAPFVPSPDEPPSVKSKKATDFPTFNDLLRKGGFLDFRAKKDLDLFDLVKPGDYVIAGMQTAGVDYDKGDYRYITDNLGVTVAMTIIVRRFGGVKQWQSEIENKNG